MPRSSYVCTPILPAILCIRTYLRMCNLYSDKDIGIPLDLAQQKSEIIDLIDISDIIDSTTAQVSFSGDLVGFSITGSIQVTIQFN